MKKVITLVLPLALLVISSANIQAVSHYDYWIDNSSTVKSHLASGGNPNEIFEYPSTIPDTNGNWIRVKSTPLYEAVNAGNTATVDDLLKAGADPNLGAYPAQLPLSAARSGDLVDKLVAAGAKVNLPADKTSKGRQPLHDVAMRSRSKDAVEALLKHGADVNATDDDQQTPLHLVTRGLDHKGDVGVIEALVDGGANVNAQNKYGATPLDNLFWEINSNKGRSPQDEYLKTAAKLLKAKGAKNNAFRPEIFDIETRSFKSQMPELGEEKADVEAPAKASSWFSQWLGGKTEL